MHFRPAILMVCVVVGCQDKKPAGPLVVETPGPETSAAATATTTGPAPVGPGTRPLDGAIEGKAFRPQAVTMDGSFVAFRQKEGADESTITFTLPVSAAAGLEDREWSFGGKVDDPVITL